MMCDNPELLVQLVREVMGGLVIIAFITGLFVFFWKAVS